MLPTFTASTLNPIALEVTTRVLWRRCFGAIGAKTLPRTAPTAVRRSAGAWATLSDTMRGSRSAAVPFSATSSNPQTWSPTL